MKLLFEIQKPFGHNLSTEQCPRTRTATNNGERIKGEWKKRVGVNVSGFKD